MEKIKHIPNHQPDDVADQKNDWKILEDFILDAWIASYWKRIPKHHLESLEGKTSWSG